MTRDELTREYGLPVRPGQETRLLRKLETLVASAPAHPTRDVPAKVAAVTSLANDWIAELRVAGVQP